LNQLQEVSALLPTRRQGPQTLLLTALALLIAAATIMLACGPAAQPIPEEGDTFTAAPQAEDGSEEPEEEPTATPTMEGGGEEPAEEPTATPTTEPTDTPAPNSTVCVSLPPEYQATPELAEGQIRVDGIAYDCFVVTPTPTPKYPELGHLNWIAVAGEEFEAQRAASGASGASGSSGQAEVEVPTAYVEITTSSNTADIVAWLQSKGLPLPQDRVASDKIYISSYVVDWELGDDFIYARLPGSLVVPLSKLPGVARIDLAGPGPSIP